MRSALFLAAALALIGCRDHRPAPPPADSLPPDSLEGSDTIHLDSGTALRSASLGAKPARKLVIIRQGLAACPATGDCRVILSWTRPAGYVAATDTARLTWLQTTPTAATLVDRAQRGTADTLFIGRPLAGASKAGTVNLCHVRSGWTGKACNSPVAWSVTAPITAPDTATGLKLTGLILKPDSFDVTQATWQSKNLATDATGRLIDLSTGAVISCPGAGTKCPQQQFCPFAVMSDGSVSMTANVAAVPECQSRFNAIPNHRATYEPVKISAADAADLGPIRIQFGRRLPKLTPNAEGVLLEDRSGWVVAEIEGWRRGGDGVWRPVPESLLRAARTS